MFCREMSRLRQSVTNVLRSCRSASISCLTRRDHLRKRSSKCK
ncbi:unnamed protein product [Chondrus crispus]|uniref:Uncharacterized protein n=1 Tax=Chondrus crispus TaxID=2769 RepID=R7QR60_CHOCR|nr:unnamed protein product [Chondrus crispus]CDF40619.1 unnamed protein product [Chondrus crispus]|eukprot:XP_005710913.1 unnamed protein product [Chondrus crispus]